MSYNNSSKATGSSYPNVTSNRKRSEPSTPRSASASAPNAKRKNYTSRAKPTTASVAKPTTASATVVPLQWFGSTSASVSRSAPTPTSSDFNWFDLSLTSPTSASPSAVVNRNGATTGAISTQPPIQPSSSSTPAPLRKVTSRATTVQYFVLPRPAVIIMDETIAAIRNAVNMSLILSQRRHPGFLSPQFGICLFKSTVIWMADQFQKRSEYFRLVSSQLSDLMHRTQTDFDRIRLTPLSSSLRQMSAIRNVESIRKQVASEIDIAVQESFSKIYGAGGNIHLLYGPSGCGKNLAVMTLEKLHLYHRASLSSPEDSLVAWKTWQFDQLTSLSLENVILSIELFFQSLSPILAAPLQYIGLPVIGLMTNVNCLFDNGIFDVRTQQPALLDCLWRCIERYCVSHGAQSRPILYMTSSSSARCFHIRELDRRIAMLSAGRGGAGGGVGGERTPRRLTSVDYCFSECFEEKRARQWLLSLTSIDCDQSMAPYLEMYPMIWQCIGKPACHKLVQSACAQYATLSGASILKHETMARWLFAVDLHMVFTPQISINPTPLLSSNGAPPSSSSSSSSKLQYQFIHCLQYCMQPQMRKLVCDDQTFWNTMIAQHERVDRLPSQLIDFALTDATLQIQTSKPAQIAAAADPTSERGLVEIGSAFMTHLYDIQMTSDQMSSFDYSKSTSVDFISQAVDGLARCASTNPFLLIPHGKMQSRIYAACREMRQSSRLSNTLPISSSSSPLALMTTPFHDRVVQIQAMSLTRDASM